MAIRKSLICLIFLSSCCLMLGGLLLIHPLCNRDDYRKELEKRQLLVKRLHLTDLCLFPDAGYTRHLSWGDLQSPFQDYPMAFEHFPSGSLVSPPLYLLKYSHRWPIRKNGK